MCFTFLNVDIAEDLFDFWYTSSWPGIITAVVTIRNLQLN